MSIIKDLKKNISNISGWSSPDKIVVFEVDDWGAIRTRSKEARDNMISRGLDLKKNRFNFYDSIASASDLEALFGVLSKHKDKNGKNAVFTAVSVVANPDFEKIKASGFNDYHYETLERTVERYFGTTEVLSIWKQGISEGLFHPEFHGREHLHPGLWLEALRNGDKDVMIAFENESLGIKAPSLKKYTGGYLSAFDFRDVKDRESQKEVIKEGLDIFNNLFGYKARHFTSSGLIHHPAIEKYLKDEEVNYIDVAKKQIEPQGGGAYKNKMYKLGQKNDNGQTYITRNVRFEPNDKGNSDWVGTVLKEIEIAFRWKKPAVISSHRVNYVGSIDETNRKEGLEKLDSLLSKIVQRWPDVQFMNVADLAEMIERK